MEDKTQSDDKLLSCVRSGCGQRTADVGLAGRPQIRLGRDSSLCQHPPQIGGFDALEYRLALVRVEDRPAESGAAPFAHQKHQLRLLGRRLPAFCARRFGHRAHLSLSGRSLPTRGGPGQGQSGLGDHFWRNGHSIHAAQHDLPVGRRITRPARPSPATPMHRGWV